ncbi:hypothetical protein F4604DRAFT_1685425 [Suillus subluteus]|nr:hypothetical protein F4604DRAFT_1685425 [Suillus subluteus]
MLGLMIYQVPIPEFRISGTPESRHPEVGNRDLEISNMFTIQKYKNLIHCHVLSAECRVPGAGCRDSGSPDSGHPAPGTQDSVNILEITESRLPTPGCRVQGFKSRYLGLGTWDSGLRTHLSISSPEPRVPEPKCRVPSSGCRVPGLQEPRLRAPGTRHSGLMKNLEITESQVPGIGARVPELGARG